MNETLKSLIENEGYELFDTQVANENNRNIYRVFISKSGGVNLDDCSKITNIISPILDLNPPIKGKYFLEVSSPGIDRKLTKPHHFKCSIGEEIKITLFNTDKIIGKLIDADDKSIVLDEDGEKQTFLYEDIEKAKLYVKW